MYVTGIIYKTLYALFVFSLPVALFAATSETMIINSITTSANSSNGGAATVEVHNTSVVNGEVFEYSYATSGTNIEHSVNIDTTNSGSYSAWTSVTTTSSGDEPVLSPPDIEHTSTTTPDPIELPQFIEEPTADNSNTWFMSIISFLRAYVEHLSF